MDSKIKVGFDISQAAYIGGVPTYVKNLTKNLSKISDLEMVYFYSSLRIKYKGDLKNVNKFKLPPGLVETIFNRLRGLPIEQLIGRVDVYHSSDWIQPPTKAKKVTTYHDVIPLKYPEWSHPKVVSVHKRRLKIVEKEIDLVIAVSQSTKKDLLEVSKIPEEKIVVIYEGVGENFTPQGDIKVAEFKKKNNLPEEFVLAVAGVGSRRNLDRVKEVCKGLNLVILGQDLNLLSDELPLLYSSAKILLYPSLYEGFGLPVLEAMACGTAVVTSNSSSLPEVGGDAVLYVDPHSVEDIGKKLKMVWNDSKVREDLTRKGLLQAKKFSWEKTAKETAEVYRKLVRSNL